MKINLDVRGELGNSLDEAYALYQANLNKADMTFEEITKYFFKKISENLPDKA